MKEVAANKYTKTSHWGNNQENCHCQGLHIWSKYEPSTQQEPVTAFPDLVHSLGHFCFVEILK